MSDVTTKKAHQKQIGGLSNVSPSDESKENTGTAAASESKRSGHAAKAFKCVQCGTTVPAGSQRCPWCRVLYIQGVRDEDLRQLEMAEEESAGDRVDMLGRMCSPVVDFDVDMGVVNYLDADPAGAEPALECPHCGAVVQLHTEKCPICDTALEGGDTGLAGLYADMDFDSDPLTEVDCPFCGEHVNLRAGVCPACGTAIEVAGPKDDAEKVSPVVKSGNVIFLHLDVETGELDYLQRLADRLGFERVCVTLDGMDESQLKGGSTTPTKV